MNTFYIIIEICFGFVIGQELDRNVYYQKLSLNPISEVFGVPGYHEPGSLRSKPEELNERAEDDSKELKDIFEKKYKFVNDETSTRFRVTDDFSSSTEKPVFSGTDDHRLAWAFRSYAVRRIVGGMATSISMYPYNVAITRSGKHWCGGSIIDEQWIITAGHCFESAFDGNDKTKLQPYIIRAGSSFHNRGGYQARVNKVFYPKHYSPGSADYDYSLARLDRPMPIGRNIAVVNLPSKNYAISRGDILIVTGWGSTDSSGYGNIPERVRFVPVPVMQLDECQNSYRFFITPRMLCAGYATGGKDACNHDSGGPAVRDGVLIGLVSFGGKQCGDPRSPGVYARISEVTDWVEKTISKNEAYTVPELQGKIDKARQRDKELQRFKARVDNKRNKIKDWLRDTLKSPSFLRLAKKKLDEVGYSTRRLLPLVEPHDNGTLDDKTIDEINLTNQINDQIIGNDDTNESDRLIMTLALQAVMYNETSSETLFPKYETSKENLDTLFAAIMDSGGGS